MKNYFSSIIFCCMTSIALAQSAPESAATGKIEIINNKKIMTDDMIFNYPGNYANSKKPIFLVNGKEVYCLTYYNREEFKKITVLPLKEGIAKFGKRGRYGVVVALLKDEVKTPYIEVVTNRIYYRCEVDGRMQDTSKTYYDEVNGNHCKVLDIRDTGNTQKLYIDFDNAIKVKHLGAGWDRTSIYITGGMISGSNGFFFVKAKKEGPVKIVISINSLQEKSILKEIKFDAVKLPTPK